MASGLRTIAIRFVGDAKGLDKTSTQGQKSLSKWRTGFKKLAGAAKIGLAAAGVAAIKFGKDSISAASDLNETVSKSNVIFGKNAGEIRKWASGAATNMGLSKQAALDAAAGFGDMFSQLGFGGGKAAGMSKKVVQLSADLGSFNNLPTADVSERIAAAFRGEYDSLQTLIPNINAARVQKKALAMTGKESADSLTAQEKAAATLAIIQHDGARAAGDFKRTSGSLANQQKILAAKFENVKAKVGKALLPIMTKLFEFLNAKALPAVKTFISFLKQNSATIKKVASVVGPLIGIIAGVIAVIKVWTAVQAILNVVMSLNPVGLIIIAVAALIAIIVVIATKTQFFQKLWAKVWGFFKAVGAWFAGPFAGFFVKAWNKVVAGVTAVKNWIVGKWNAVVGFVKKLPGRVWAFLKKLWTRAKHDAAAVWHWIRRQWNRVVGFVKRIPRRVWAFLKNLWAKEKRAMLFIARYFIRKWHDVLNFISKIPGKIRRFFAKAKKWLLSAGRNLIHGLTSGIRKAMHGIKSWLKKHVWNPIVKGVKSLFGISSPSTVFAGFGFDMIRGLIKGLFRAKPGKLVKKIFGGVSDAARSALGWLTSLFGGGGGSSSANMALGKQMAAAFGWTGPQWRALRALWIGESGWRNEAQNPVSTAYGIAQFLDSTWATVGARKTSDPSGQIAAGLKYIAQVYGTPANAYAKWLARSPHWYEKGTDYVPRTGPAVLHKGEMVLPADVAEAVRNGVGQPIVVENHIEIGGEVVRVVRSEITADHRGTRRHALAGAGVAT